jgi:hypothetical protein
MAAYPDDVHGSISAKEDRYLAHNTKNSHRESPRRDTASQRSERIDRGRDEHQTCPYKAVNDRDVRQECLAVG